MMTDPIADMLTRIRNANLALHATVSMPSSKLKEQIARLLASEGYVEGYDVTEAVRGTRLTIRLKFQGKGNRDRVIKGLRRVSRPGRRVYRGADKLPRSQGGMGTVIVSTSQGLLPDSEARRRRLGGELLCEVW
ncbi:MAG: 30S ribosomal protein S8 [bacterium]|nr:30S ribosomal protein S8 [bacterium]